MVRKKEKELRKFTILIKDCNTELGDKGECIAQSIIALRNFEDARMRIGKVIQYAEDGISIYDK